LPEEIHRFIKDNSLPGKGIGCVDAAVLCSVQEGVLLATFDQTLRSRAVDIGIPYIPSG
jgi:rRNA-processing protein FCF1